MGGNPSHLQGSARLGCCLQRAQAMGGEGWKASSHFSVVAHCIATLYACVFRYMHKQLAISLLSYITAKQKQF